MSNAKAQTAAEIIPPAPIPPLSANSPVVEETAITRAVHVVTMSKGGVGKSVVSWNLIQYLRDRGQSVTGVDLDPMTHSLADYGSLGIRVVDLLTGEDAELNTDGLDRLCEDLITANAGENFVLDNGAAGFVGLTRYLCNNAFADLLRGFGGRLVIHAVLGGGTASAHCLIGLNTLLDAFKTWPEVRFVIWLNEHDGQFAVDDMWFETMAIYREMMAENRVIGVIRLERLKPAFLAEFNRMRLERLTYGEAIASPKFMTMNKQRLRLTQRGIWDQLDALGIVS